MLTAVQIFEQLEAESESKIRRGPGMRGMLRSLQLALVRRRIRKLVLLYDTIVAFDAYAMYPRHRRPKWFFDSTPRMLGRIRFHTLLGTIEISAREMLIIIDEARAAVCQSLEQKLGM